MIVKFSNAQIEFLRTSGVVKAGKLTIDLAILEASAPVRVRTSADERLEKFRSVLEKSPANDKGIVTLSVPALAATGLPFASLANPAYWSGTGDGSQVAFAAGYKSKHDTVLEESGSVRLNVILTPLTEADRTAHNKRIAALEEKKAKAAAAKKASEAPAVGAVVAPNVQDDEGAPVGDESEESDESSDEVSEE